MTEHKSALRKLEQVIWEGEEEGPMILGGPFPIPKIDPFTGKIRTPAEVKRIQKNNEQVARNLRARGHTL